MSEKRLQEIERRIEGIKDSSEEIVGNFRFGKLAK